MKTLYKESLFDLDGRLRLDRLDEGAREVLLSIQGRLRELGRRMFLPLDLLVSILERGNEELARLIALSTEGTVQLEEVGERLKVLAAEIEEIATPEPPELDRSSFSRGFTRILEEAWELAQERAEPRILESDLLRAVLWRLEAVESASIRWSVRRLSEGKGDTLFEERGLLRMESFGETAQGILRGAMKIASSHGTSFLGTPHLVAMMASVQESVLWRSARGRGLDPSRLREELLRLIGSKPEGIPEFLIGRKTLTPRVIRILQGAMKLAQGSPAEEKHLVEAFLLDGGSSLELVQALGLEAEIREALADPRVLAGAEPVEAAIHYAARRNPSPTLDTLGRDLTAEAVEGKLPIIVGREKELRRVLNVLMRREQRNPLLTGEAGVGKTALAVGLAQLIAAGKGPEKLRGHRVVEINGASLMSGTSYRGDLEARIKNLIEEASQDVILFIDEAHAVFAPRSGSNTPAEVPNHFKSALASGDIAVVGATTEAEYHRWFEQDPALKRRFERIEVVEPTREMVLDILKTTVKGLELEYGVSVAPEAIEDAVDLSVRYMPEQRLPDKAKKVLMDACIAQIHGLRGEEVTLPEFSLPLVGKTAIAEQIHLKTGVPLERLIRGEVSWWEGLETRLQSAVLGQDQAMIEVAQAIVASRLRNADRRRPLAVLGFVGPSGVGKSSAATALAEEIFYDERALIRLDMSDFQEPHSLSRLIGSPPGYVGYEDADMLVTPLRRRPSSVVLLEDFDRAHPRIQDRLLRLIDEGELADTRGHNADATNAIFVLTMSVEETSSAPIGFGSSSSAPTILKGLPDQNLARRLGSRLDRVIPFHGLDTEEREELKELVEKMIYRFQGNLEQEYGRKISLDESLLEEILRRAGNARRVLQIQDVIDELLLQPVTAWLLGGATSPVLELRFLEGKVEVLARKT